MSQLLLEGPSSSVEQRVVVVSNHTKKSSTKSQIHSHDGSRKSTSSEGSRQVSSTSSSTSSTTAIPSSQTTPSSQQRTILDDMMRFFSPLFCFSCSYHNDHEEQQDYLLPPASLSTITLSDKSNSSKRASRKKSKDSSKETNKEKPKKVKKVHFENTSDMTQNVDDTDNIEGLSDQRHQTLHEAMSTKEAAPDPYSIIKDYILDTGLLYFGIIQNRDIEFHWELKNINSEVKVYSCEVPAFGGGHAIKSVYKLAFPLQVILKLLTHDDFVMNIDTGLEKYEV